MARNQTEIDDNEDVRPEFLRRKEVESQLRERINELLTAEPSKLPALTIEVQRLRVAVLLLREMENQITDQNTYREVALLNRLLSGKDIESEAEKKKSMEDADKAARVLEAQGISPESAHRMAKALASVLPAGTGGTEHGTRLIPDDDLNADEPDETAD